MSRVSVDDDLDRVDSARGEAGRLALCLYDSRAGATVWSDFYVAAARVARSGEDCAREEIGDYCRVALPDGRASDTCRSLTKCQKPARQQGLTNIIETRIGCSHRFLRV